MCRKLFSVFVVLIAVNSARAVFMRTGFEPEEGYSVGKLTPSQPNPVGDVGWGNSVWTDLGGNTADPQGVIVASTDAPEGLQYYQRLGGGNNNLAIREFPAISVADGDFSIRWQVRIDTDQATPPYFNNVATIEVDDTGPGGRIMTFRYDASGNLNLSSVQNGIAKWDGTGDPALVSAVNQFVRGGLNVYWSTKEIEVFMEDVQGQWISIGTFAFRETDTNQVDRIFLGIGPGGTAQQGVSWDDIVITSKLLPEPVVSPALAADPSPADEATDVPRDTVLSWTPGIYAPPVNGHIIYLSEVFSDVNNGIGGVTLSEASYAPAQRLDFETTYYWRVDEVNAPPDSTVYPGDVWSFTTEPVGYPINGAKITATASSAGEGDFGPEKTIDGSGLDENSLHSTQPTDMWISGSEPQGAWIQYEFDKVYKLHEMWVWNSNQLFEGLFGFGFKDVTVEYSTNGTDWTAVPDVPEFAKAPGAAGYAHNTTVDFGGAPAKLVKLTATSNWGGVLPQYGLSEVRFFAIPVSAREPSPAAGAVDVNPDVILTWRAGREAATHNVYLSTDQQAVIDSTAPVTAVTDTSYSTTLNLSTTYYWRVDEVNDVETPSTWQGDIWDFTTRQFVVVDGFEDYNDYPSYEIYSTWLDGYENPANGSQVGYLMPPLVEKTIVHGGRQSMPLLYSNTGGATYSEATRTFAVPQDWTKYGIATLQLWFYGTAGNTGQLYVKINGVKVPYGGNAADLAVESWQPWDIDLTTAGVNIQSVTSLAIGIDGNAAAGTLYIDDIQLQ